MGDRKGVDLDEERLGPARRNRGRETIIRIFYLRRILFSVKEKRKVKKQEEKWLIMWCGHGTFLLFFISCSFTRIVC